MEEWVNEVQERFKTYYNSFSGLSEEHCRNFKIKYEHSVRVATLCEQVAKNLKLSADEINVAFTIGLFHDIGRFKQLIEFNTFNDSKSIDHADYSVKVIEDKNMLSGMDGEIVHCIKVAIINHNKRELPKGLSKMELLFAKLIRDADKLDILKVLTDYYTNPKASPNHTLTWEMPRGSVVSTQVSKQILAEKLVSKEKIKNELDIKIMQLSWVYDINFKPSFEILLSANLTKSNQVIKIGM